MPSAAETFIVVNLLLAAVASFVVESQLFHLPVNLHVAYSKHAANSSWSTLKGRSLPARAGMVLIYTVPFLANVVLLRVYQAWSRPRLAAALLVLHFAKRVLECLFLHQYSNKGLKAVVVAFVATSYSLSSWYNVFFISRVEPPSVPAAQAALAILVWLAGESGNLYHHWLLRRLRNASAASETGPSSDSSPKSTYKIPEGGLFGLVNSPHYLFELISLSALVVLGSGHAVPLWDLVRCSAYLGGRSVATTAFYHKKIDNFPKERKHLIPYLF